MTKLASEEKTQKTSVAQKSVFETKFEKILARSSNKEVEYILRRLKMYEARVGDF